MIPLNFRKAPAHTLLKEAHRIAKGYTSCPNCKSQRISAGVGKGLAKSKPYVACKECGALLAWG